MIKELIKLSNHLDKIGRNKEADLLDLIIKTSGDVVNLDDYRDEDKDTYEKQDPKLLMNQYSEIQKIINELNNSENAYIELILHDDGETYTSLDSSYVVLVTDDELGDIYSGEKIKNIINENRWIDLDTVINREKLMELK